jgi:hypothetical protein
MRTRKKGETHFPKRCGLVGFGKVRLRSQEVLDVRYSGYWRKDRRWEGREVRGNYILTRQVWEY